MFGLTKREQRWKAEQQAAELLVGLAQVIVRAAADVRIAEANGRPPASGAFNNDASSVNAAGTSASSEPDEQTIAVSSPAAVPAVLQTADGVKGSDDAQQ